MGCQKKLSRKENKWQRGRGNFLSNCSAGISRSWLHLLSTWRPDERPKIISLLFLQSEQWKSAHCTGVRVHTCTHRILCRVYRTKVKVKSFYLYRYVCVHVTLVLFLVHIQIHIYVTVFLLVFYFRISPFKIRVETGS